MGHESDYITPSLRGHIPDVRFARILKALLPEVSHGNPTPKRRGGFSLSAAHSTISTHEKSPPALLSLQANNTVLDLSRNRQQINSPRGRSHGLSERKSRVPANRRQPARNLSSVNQTLQSRGGDECSITDAVEVQFWPLRHNLVDVRGTPTWLAAVAARRPVLTHSLRPE